MKPTLHTLLTLLPGLLMSTSVIATTVLPVSLERMSKKAELIFYGAAINNEVKVDDVSGRVATFSTFEIIDVIKGDTGTKHTIKQIGGQLPGSKIFQRVQGVPRFTVGEQYIIFLPQASRLGFSSPIGLSQGRYIVQKQNGLSTVSNVRAPEALINRSTPTGSDKPLIKKSTTTSLSEFLKTVRDLASQ